MTFSRQDTWQILLVDDDEDDYRLTRSMLNKAGRKIHLDWAQTYEKGRERLTKGSYDAVLIDYDLGSNSGIKLIREMCDQNYEAPLILFTGRGSIEVDMEAMEAGATLYLTKKEANPLLLERLIRYAIGRKRDEKNVQDSEDRYQTLFNSIDEGFCVVQVLFDENEKPVDYVFLEINKEFEKQTGLHDPGGKSARELVPDLEEHWFEIYGKVALTGESVRFENSSIPMQRWFNVNAFRVGEPEERKVGILFTDISQRKKIEKELGDYTRQLKQSNKALQDFAFMASHDLREPLRKMRNFSDQLMKGARHSLGDEEVDYIRRIQEAGKRMESMLNGLLAYSRVTGQGRAFKVTDLNKVAEEVLLDLEMRLVETAGKVELEELPVIKADPLQMHQLFQNLLTNGLKFHKPGSPPHVRIFSRRPDNGTIELLVEDNGIGFDIALADSLFKPFRRLVSKSDYPGDGMGLAICYKIVERHGGKIMAQSEPGKGATFIVQFPI